MTENIRVAVIGAGYIGRFHIKTELDPIQRQVIGTPSELVGFFDANPDAKNVIKSAFPDYSEQIDNIKSATSIEDLFSLEPEVVIIGTPVNVASNRNLNLHKYFVNKCFDAGVKVVMCENPISGDVNIASEMFQQAEKHGAYLSTNWTLRNDPLASKIVEEIQDGKIGKLEKAIVVYKEPVSNHRDSGMHKNSDEVKHTLHLLSDIIGEDYFVEVKNLRLAERIEGEFTDYTSYELVSKDGLTAHITSMSRAPENKKTRLMYFYGKDGRFIEADFIEGRRHLIVDHPGHWNVYEPDTPIKPSAYMSLPLLHKRLAGVASKVKRGERVTAPEEDVRSTLQALSLAELLDKTALESPNWYVPKVRLNLERGVYKKPL